MRQNKGFTLLEILLVIAAIGILASIVLVAINPNRQLEAARNAKRRSDINTIQKAIQQYSIDNNGQYPTGIETGAKAICRGGTPVGCIDLSILAPTYIASIPEPDSNYYYVRRSNNNIEVSHPRDNIWNIGGTPSLDLNFASNKSLIDSVSGKNLIDFTRNSTATYVGEDGLIKTAGVNEPRFDHDPTTGESLGLLVEEERTNLLTGGDDFGPSYWTKLNSIGVSTNVTTSPDGTANADKFVENTDTSHKVLARNFTLTANATYTFSIFVKSAERSNIMMHLRKSDYSTRFGGFFNLATKTFTGETAAGGTLLSSSIIEYPNNWFRLTITGSIGVNTEAVTTLYLLDTNNNIGYTGNGNSGLFVWGAQVEQGSFPTSYIPTSGSAVTRSSDSASITGTNFSSWYNYSQSTVFIQASRLGGNTRLIELAGLGGENRLWAHNEWYTSSYQLGETANNLQGITIPIGGFYKYAYGFEYNGSNTIKSAVRTGLNLVTSTTANRSIPNPVAGTVSLNFVGNGINSKIISRLTYWPTRLQNSTLQSITQ